MNMDIKEKAVAYYLIDYDSVGQNGFNGIERLSEKDKVTIFYIVGKSAIDLSFLEKIYSSKAEIKFHKIDNETSLRCLISAYLGYNIMGTNSNTKYHIVSNDKEFKTLKKFWAEKEVHIEISPDIIAKISAEYELKAKKEENPLLHKTISHFMLSNKDKEMLYRIIIDGRRSYPSSKNQQCIYIKQKINNLLPKNSESIYNAIKSYI